MVVPSPSPPQGNIFHQADERIKLGYIYTMEYYSAIKKNEIMPVGTAWMQLEIIIQSEVSRKEILYDITYMWNLK